MNRLTKILLALTIINFVAAMLFLTDLINVVSVPSLYLTFPLAPIFFGLFLISLMLQKEVAAFDAEQRAHHDPDIPASHSESVESAHHEYHPPIRA